MTAVSERLSAILSAARPVTQPNPGPNQLKPAATVKTNPMPIP